MRIPDGGITGSAFSGHVRRSDRPVVDSPSAQTIPLPPGPVRRPVLAPEIHWTRSVVRRAGEARAAVLAVRDPLCDGVADLGFHDRTPGCPPVIHTGTGVLCATPTAAPTR